MADIQVIVYPEARHNVTGPGRLYYRGIATDWASSPSPTSGEFDADFSLTDTSAYVVGEGEGAHFLGRHAGPRLAYLPLLRQAPARDAPVSGFSAALAEAASAADALGDTMAAAASLAEAANAVDARTATMAAAAALAEAAAAADHPAAGDFAASLAEIAVAVDTPAGAMAATASLAEAGAAVDSRNGAMAANAGLAETGAAADATGATGGGDFAAGLAETGAAADNLSATAAMAASLAEAGHATDAAGPPDGPPAPPAGPVVPNYAALGAADFETAIAERLLPRGLAWTRVAGSVLQRFWRVIADAIAGVHARTADLTEREAWPPASVELLPDWERVLGLPDPCLGANPVTSARQASVAARLAATGGQSIPYFVQLAQLLGGTIAVTEYQPFRLGVDAWGDPLRGASWAYVWQVELSGASLFWFEFGASTWGEPFWQVLGGAIACEIKRLSPAHTMVVFTAAEGLNPGPFLADISLTDSLAVVG